ncbi:MAG: FAD:protein FMN transferase [Gammaproteobacteria bacterium]|nr:FAD:protein FMN transferase [Gammaproteobacteria bacterium]
MNRRQLLLALPSALLLSACGQTPEQLFTRRVHTFGSWVDLSLYGLEPGRAEVIAARLERELSFMNSAWHAWKPSLLEEVNAKLRTGQVFAAPDAILPLIRQCKSLYEASEGLFNPALGLLFRLWGFHGDKSWESRPLPEAAKIRELLTDPPGMDDVEIDGNRLRGHNARLSLDFGGFAKGYGLDRLAEILRQEGVTHALVSATSNLVALGTHGSRPWRIAIRHPRREGGVLAWLELADGECCSTSGDYERYFERDGRRYHHILDPRTGYPATGAQAVTLLHRDGAVADAASTALMVAGPRDFARIARRLGVSEALMVDADGRLLVSEGMRPRLHFPDGRPDVLSVAI